MAGSRIFRKRTIAKPHLITVGDLTAKVVLGKFGEYRYLSPRNGYRLAWRYDKMAYMTLQHGERHIRLPSVGFKRWTLVEIRQWLENSYMVENTPYTRAKRGLARTERASTEKLAMEVS